MERFELEQALTVEALAPCRYEIFVEIARSEGLHYIAKILEETAHNELAIENNNMDQARFFQHSVPVKKHRR